MSDRSTRLDPSTFAAKLCNTAGWISHIRPAQAVRGNSDAGRHRMGRHGRPAWADHCRCDAIGISCRHCRQCQCCAQLQQLAEPAHCQQPGEGRVCKPAVACRATAFNREMAHTCPAGLSAGQGRSKAVPPAPEMVIAARPRRADAGCCPQSHCRRGRRQCHEGQCPRAAYNGTGHKVPSAVTQPVLTGCTASWLPPLPECEMSISCLLLLGGWTGFNCTSVAALLAMAAICWACSCDVNWFLQYGTC